MEYNNKLHKPTTEELEDLFREEENVSHENKLFDFFKKLLYNKHVRNERKPKFMLDITFVSFMDDVLTLKVNDVELTFGNEHGAQYPKFWDESERFPGYFEIDFDKLPYWFDTTDLHNIIQLERAMIHCYD